jgi:hypothetical protein
MSGNAETFVPLRLRRRHNQLVDTERKVHEPGVLIAIGRALHWQTLLDEGVVAHNGEIAEQEGLERSTVTRLLPLALLAPGIIEECLAGQHPRTLTLLWLQRHRLPDDWQAQCETIGQFE